MQTPTADSFDSVRHRPVERVAADALHALAESHVRQRPLRFVPRGLAGRPMPRACTWTDWANPRPHLHRDWAHPCHICTRTAHALQVRRGPRRRAPQHTHVHRGPGRRGGRGYRVRRGLHRDWAHPAHICAGTGRTLATSAPGLGSPQPRRHRDRARPAPGRLRSFTACFRAARRTPPRRGCGVATPCVTHAR